MDPGLAERFIHEGRLPNLAKLRDLGTFRPLRTTFPAISPVAWSTFQTGVNPGKHNIYDFLGRDLANYLPYLSSAQISKPKRRLKVGKYFLPLGKSGVKGLRKSTPFWHLLGKAGVFSSVIRVPVTFPPEKFPGSVALRNVRAGSEGQPGNVLLLHHSRSGRQVSRRRRADTDGALRSRISFLCARAGKPARDRRRIASQIQNLP